MGIAVPSNVDGSSRPAAPSAARIRAAPGSYKAQSATAFAHGLAADGGNTRANRQAIIDANPSLQQDPDRVIVGNVHHSRAQ